MERGHNVADSSSHKNYNSDHLPIGELIMPFVFQPPPREHCRGTVSGDQPSTKINNAAELSAEAQKNSTGARIPKFHLNGGENKPSQCNGDNLPKSITSDSTSSFDFMIEAEKMVTDLCNSNTMVDFEESEELEKILSKTTNLQAFANHIRKLNKESKPGNSDYVFKSKDNTVGYLSPSSANGLDGSRKHSNYNCRGSRALCRETSVENSTVCCQANLFQDTTTELSFPEKIAKLTEEICQSLNAMPPSATVSGISRICNEAKMYFDESDQFRCTSKSELKNIVLAFLQLAYSWLYLSSENGLQDIIHFFHPALKDKFAKWKHITKAVLDSMIHVILDNNRACSRLHRHDVVEYSSDKSSCGRDFPLSPQSSAEGTPCQSGGVIPELVLGYNAQSEAYEYRPSKADGSKQLANNTSSYRTIVRPSQGDPLKQGYPVLRPTHKKYGASNSLNNAAANQNRVKLPWNNNKNLTGPLAAKSYPPDHLDSFGKYFQNYRCDSKNIFQKLSNMDQQYYGNQAEVPTHNKTFPAPESEVSSQQSEEAPPWMFLEQRPPCYNPVPPQYSAAVGHKQTAGRNRFSYPEFKSFAAAKNKSSVHKRYVGNFLPKKMTGGLFMHTLIDSDSSDDTRELVYMKPGSYNVPMKPRKRFSANKSRLASHMFAMQNLEDACDSICSTYVQTWKPTCCNPRKKHQTESAYFPRKYNELPPLEPKQNISLNILPKEKYSKGNLYNEPNPSVQANPKEPAASSTEKLLQLERYEATPDTKEGTENNNQQMDEVTVKSSESSSSGLKKRKFESPCCDASRKLAKRIGKVNNNNNMLV